MVERPDLVVMCVVLFRNKILLNQKVDGAFNGFWSIPAGLIAEGESLPKATNRIFFEYTNIESNFKSIFGVVSENILDGTEKEHFLINVCEIKPSTQKISLHSDLGEYKWFALKNLNKSKSLIIPNDYQIIEKIIVKKLGKYFNCKIEKFKGDFIVRRFDRIS